MTDRLRLTILGCASSPGVPRITGDWGACDPREPKNRRRRCSALVERIGPAGRTSVVIDCGPDFREQMLSAGVQNLDAVVMTHAHADHIYGLDDLRGYFLTQRERVAVYADDTTFERLAQAFDYCFEMPPGSSYPPIARRARIEAGTGFVISGAGGDIMFQPFPQQHGDILTLGFRIGPLAYCCDVSGFPEAALSALAGVRHVVIDALQYRTHPSHFSVAQALEWVERLGAASATLTHMHTPLDYATLCAELPDHVRPGFDGLELEFEL